MRPPGVNLRRFGRALLAIILLTAAVACIGFYAFIASDCRGQAPGPTIGSVIKLFGC